MAGEESRLSVRGIEAGYGDRPVLRGIDLDIAPGEIVALVGPNGTGKSTLVRVLGGSLRPTGGAARLGGEDLLALRPAERARRIAVVPQSVRLPPAFTVAEVVLMGRTPHLSWWAREGRRDRGAARRALRLTELERLAARKVEELSGGEAQRVVLARALAQEPRVLLLDEATAHLDLRHQAAILRLVRTLARERGLAVLAVFHDLNQAAARADRIAVLAGGRLRAVGPPAEVIDERLVAEVWGVEVRILRDAHLPHPVVLTAGETPGGQSARGPEGEERPGPAAPARPGT